MSTLSDWGEALLSQGEASPLFCIPSQNFCTTAKRWASGAGALGWKTIHPPQYSVVRKGVKVRILLLYHTRWGNCRKIAEALAHGLGESGHQVVLREVSKKGEPYGDFEVLVAGSGTRVGRMTRCLRVALKKLPVTESKPFMAFGTGIERFRDRGDPQSADEIHAFLSGRGLIPVADPFKAAVAGVKGPLSAGEEEMALVHGVEMGRKLLAQGNEP